MRARTRRKERETRGREGQTVRSFFFLFHLGITLTHTHTRQPPPHCAPTLPPPVPQAATRPSALRCEQRPPPAHSAAARGRAGGKGLTKHPPSLFALRSAFRPCACACGGRRAARPACTAACPGRALLCAASAAGGAAGEKAVGKKGLVVFLFPPFVPLFSPSSLSSLFSLSPSASLLSPCGSLRTLLPLTIVPRLSSVRRASAASGARPFGFHALLAFFFSSLSSAARPVFYLAAAASRPALRRPP